MESLATRNNFHILVHNNNQESNLLKDTQIELRNIADGKYSEDTVRQLPGRMLATVVKSMMEDLPAIETVCKDVNWFIGSSKTINKEDIMNQNSWINEFACTLKQQSDFIKCYIFEENGKANIWIIIKETGLDNNLKYLKLHREYEHNGDSNILLFEEDEEKEILEQISYISKDYKEVVKDGK